MKKNYLLALGFLLFGSASKAQILNQSANWPNAAWLVTGSYSTDPTAFESNPLTTANFAFDDDDAGGSHEDNIAAESPVIDLTAAFNGGEKNLVVTVDYVYRYLANDQLRLEYWNTSASAWVAWGSNIPGNTTSISDLYCSGTKTTYTSAALDISNFTPAQLSGFRYRISYDDDPAGTDWNYGFCFSSPTIKSIACSAPGVPVASAITSTSAVLAWTSVGGASGYEYVLDTNSANPTTGGTPIAATTYTASNLTALTLYYFHVRSACSGSSSDWVTGSFRTATENDNCSGAIGLSVNSDYGCAATTAGSLFGSTNSGIASATGTADDDVWFSFVATSTSHRIVISNVAGTPTDLVHQVFSGACGTLTSISVSDPDTSNLTGLTPGATYYVRVFSYTSNTVSTTTFNICVGTPPPPPVNDECVNATALEVDSNFCTGSNTNGTNENATNSGVALASCFNYGQNDVWFKFVVPATTATVNVSTDFTGGTLVDSEVALYSGACGSLTQVACDQDGGTTTLSNGSSYNSLITNATVTAGQTYYVRVAGYSSSNAGTFCLQVSTNQSLGLNDVSANGLKVYPNPVKDVLTIDNTSNISEIRIFDVLGQQVLHRKVDASNAQINLSTLAKGTYVVKIAAENAVKTLKVVKQ